MEVNGTEFVTNRQWDSYARRIERETLRAKGESLTATSIARRAYRYIIEERSDEKGVIVTKGWRQAMRSAVTEKP